MPGVACVRDRRYRAGALALIGVLLLQAMLGITTLLWNVPMLLALAHQLVAMLALIVATLHAQTLVAARQYPAQRESPEGRLAAA